MVTATEVSEIDFEIQLLERRIAALKEHRGQIETIHLRPYYPGDAVPAPDQCVLVQYRNGDFAVSSAGTFLWAPSRINPHHDIVRWAPLPRAKT
jgi:hypothetical protein